jgi:hypothetical protein
MIYPPCDYRKMGSFFHFNNPMARRGGWVTRFRVDAIGGSSAPPGGSRAAPTSATRILPLRRQGSLPDGRRTHPTFVFWPKVHPHHNTSLGLACKWVCFFIFMFRRFISLTPAPIPKGEGRKKVTGVGKDTDRRNSTGPYIGGALS